MSLPHLKFEQEIVDTHQTYHIAGIDEAGRGALAGPVVAAAVILPLDTPYALQQLASVNDSKQLTHRKRETLYELITIHALTWGVGQSSAEVIDEIGIVPANHRAMTQAIHQLNPTPQYLLLDGRERLKNLNIHQQSIIKGDSQSLSIAAASIIAKVTRDRLLIQLDSHYPHYGFAQHKGYLTPQHQKALQKHGACPIHRHSFRPIYQPLL